LIIRRFNRRLFHGVKMQYIEFEGKKISQLGLGAMRLPTVNGNNAEIDVETATEMVEYAINHGVNYFDTAWGYHDGNSEPVIGKILSAYPRESYFLASKFPGYDLANMDKVEEIFETQLKRTGAEYFDFYMYHNVCELNIDAYMDEKNGIFDYLVKQKREGRIKHLGFSSHGSMEILKRFIDAYGEELEFCQLQVNYLDWKYQKADEKVKYVAGRGLPIWVMEPLRGGKLADIKEKDALLSMRPDEEIPAWAFRFLQGMPEVAVILSGMSDMQQLKDNINTFETHKPLTAAENTKLLDIASRIVNGVPCTECRYCTEKCPKKLDIPRLISLYNEHVFTDRGFYAPMTLASMSANEQPDCCIGCRSCEKVCPQNIEISKELHNFCEMLSNDK